jgi:hypothetical protein
VRDIGKNWVKIVAALFQFFDSLFPTPLLKHNTIQGNY